MNGDQTDDSEPPADENALTMLARAAAEVEYEIRAVPVSSHDRFAAKSWDLMIAIAAYVLAVACVVVLGSTFGRDALLANGIILLCAMVFQTVVNGLNLGTDGSPGKRMSEHRILRANGEIATLSRRAIRCVIAHGAWLIFCWSFVALVLLDGVELDKRPIVQSVMPIALFTAAVQAIVSSVMVSYTQRTLHDYLTDTIVATPQTRTVRPTRHGFQVIMPTRQGEEGA